MRALLPFPIALLVVAPPAHAEDCGNITAKGVCQDAKTLVYCEDGDLETVRCPAGEVCAVDAERFNGAAGCIATRYAGCGAVPEQGLCAGSTLLYCANGRVEELECQAGTSCQPVSHDGAVDFDCVASAGFVSPTTPDAGESDDTEVEPGEDGDGIDDSTPVDPGDAVPLPTVQRGGAGPAADFGAAGDVGCLGGPGGAGGLIAVGLAFLLLRRRLTFSR